ncbi:hypothetical protein M5K25_022206 [Dendrobium thyrsiflorum]|uniref:Uncharacterized protein n=1 Tax=Dendrobium thyrsiflorum TaxID=117978 RepID=A0ABD0U5U5_DENTH
MSSSGRGIGSADGPSETNIEETSVGSCNKNRKNVRRGWQRAEDLVYVHTNLHLLSRKTPTYMKGDNRMWDVDEDGFESLEDMGILEIANLSLDEPELEAMIFIEDVIEVQRQTTEETNPIIPSIE